MISVAKNQSTITTQKPLLSKKEPTKTDGIFSFFPFTLLTSKPVVAVLRLEGTIGKAGAMKTGLNLASLNKRIEQAFKIDKVAAVCLCVNSPGGSPAQSELICNRIVELSEKKKIPVYTFVEDVAASGGYWIACAGKEIYATKSSIIGSIGVISSGFGFHEAIAKLGIERRVYTEGKSKSVLDPFMPAKKTDIDLIKKLQKSIHDHFKDSVKSCRGRMITQDDDIVFNGEFWTGQIAHDFGLIDGIDDMYSFCKRKFGEDVKFEYIEERKSFFKKLFKLSSNPSFAIDDAQIQNLADSFADSLTDTVINRIEEGRFKMK